MDLPERLRPNDAIPADRAPGGVRAATRADAARDVHAARAAAGDGGRSASATLAQRDGLDPARADEQLANASARSDYARPAGRSDAAATHAHDRGDFGAEHDGDPRQERLSVLERRPMRSRPLQHGVPKVRLPMQAQRSRLHARQRVHRNGVVPTQGCRRPVDVTRACARGHAARLRKPMIHAIAAAIIGTTTKIWSATKTPSFFA